MDFWIFLLGHRLETHCSSSIMSAALFLCFFIPLHLHVHVYDI
jgi:hypothetical protein